MGLFDTLGNSLRRGRRRERTTGLSIGVGDQDRDRDPDRLNTLAAEADATRIRLSDHIDDAVSPIPDPGDAPDGSAAPTRHAMPADKPDPRAQWDGAAGRWIVWDTEAGDWVPVD